MTADRLPAFVRGLEARGIALVVEGPAIDSASPSGKAFFGMLDIFAEFRPDRIGDPSVA